MPKLNFSNVKSNVKNESQCRFGHRKVTTSKNKLKDTPIKHGYHLEDYERQCVYLHFYDKEEKPFYIGQGTIQRAFVFKGNRRNSKYNEKVKDINLIHVEIVAIDVTSEEGVNIETQLISAYKFIEDGGSLVNTEIGGRGGSRGKYSDNKLSIPVVQLDRYGNFIKEWASASEAAAKLSMDSSCISKCCRHVPRYNSHKGFKWEYSSNYNGD